METIGVESSTTEGNHIVKGTGFKSSPPKKLFPRINVKLNPQQSINSSNRSLGMATFELYRRSTIGMCLTETLDDMVQNGTLSPELAFQVLVQFDKSMTEALETKVKSKVTIKGHLHTYRFCDNVWTFILQDAMFKNEDAQETVGRVKIVACDSKLLTQ
uniref:Transcription initiation factor IIA subunit 2 n=3 Tax=Populus TaxID=3689 RepID=A0A4U5R0G1_POPAL|nr:Transcription initiation factor IIA subunit 2 [Populus alba]